LGSVCLRYCRVIAYKSTSALAHNVRVSVSAVTAALSCIHSIVINIIRWTRPLIQRALNAVETPMQAIKETLQLFDRELEFYRKKIRVFQIDCLALMQARANILGLWHHLSLGVLSTSPQPCAHRAGRAMHFVPRTDRSGVRVIVNSTAAAATASVERWINCSVCLCGLRDKIGAQRHTTLPSIS